MYGTRSSTHFFFTATNKDAILSFIPRTPGNVRTTASAIVDWCQIRSVLCPSDDDWICQIFYYWRENHQISAERISGSRTSTSGSKLELPGELSSKACFFEFITPFFRRFISTITYWQIIYDLKFSKMSSKSPAPVCLPFSFGGYVVNNGLNVFQMIPPYG